MSKFTIFNQTISFLESSDRYYAATQERRAAMRQAETDFVNFYRSKGNIRSVLQQYMETAGVITKQKALDVLYKKLPNLGIYDVTATAFEKACWNLDEAGDAYDEIVDQYNEIEEELALEKEYRAERKASRGQFVGGGFGMGGAIKGAVGAEALNMATGLGHSMFNAIGNLGSEIAASNAKERLYSSEKTYARLCKGVRFSIWDIYIAYMEFINDYFGDDELYFTNSEFKEDKAEALFENAKQIPNKRKELLVEALSYCPYYADVLVYIFENYPEERRNVRTLAEFYHIDMSSHYEAFLASLYENTRKTSEESLLSTRESILKNMELFGIFNSETLAQLDKTYMALIFEEHYKTTMPGSRDAAVELLQNFDTKPHLKEAFAQENDIWELTKDCRLKFSETKKQELVKAEYSVLVNNKAPEEKISALLDQMLTIFGIKNAKGDFASGLLKETYFLLLCDAEEGESFVDEKIFEKKEAVLKDVINQIEHTSVLFESSNLDYLKARKGQANKLAKSLKFVNLTPGEYVLMAYTPHLANDQTYNSGFVLTDRRLFCKGCGNFEIPVDHTPLFKKAGFLSDDITITDAGKELKIVATHISGKKQVAECLESVFAPLNRVQKELEVINIEREEDAKEQLMLCVQANPFLVQYFDMSAATAQWIAEGEAAIKQRQKRQIAQRMDSVNQKSPASIASVWQKLCFSPYDKEMYAVQLNILARYLREIAETATSVACLEEVTEALQKLGSLCAEEKAQEIQKAIEGRREEAERLDEQARQKGIVDKIWSLCKTKKLESILASWDSFLQCGCETTYYDHYLKRLDEAIVQLIEQETSISNATDSRDLLTKTNAERYGKHIELAEQKICALDIAQRTYRGVVFDKIEDIALAQEEEKRLDIILRTVAKDDPASVEAAIAQISESTSKIKQVYLDTLNGFSETLSTQQRTYRGVLYDTTELAEAAKSAYVAARTVVDEVNWDDEANVLAAYNQVGAINHAVNEEFITRLKKRLDVFDQEKRTVNGILFDTIELADTARKEVAFIHEKMALLNDQDEECMLAIKADISTCTTEVKNNFLTILDKKLQEYDTQIRTFRGTVYDTREMAAKLREEETAIRNILSTVNENDEESMLAAVAEFEKLTTFLKDAPIASMKNMLTTYDINVRTVEGVLYDTREEANLVAGELRRAQEIMETVSAEDEESILNAQKLILELTTFVKDEKYAQLKAMWDAYDLQKRTYANIVFGTRSQAQSAQQVHAEFMTMFTSADLSQRKTLTTLRNFIEDQIPAELKPQTTQMVYNVQVVLDEVDSILQLDSQIDLATNKKESADLHKRIETVIPKMTAYRMDTTQMQTLKEKHYASLNAAKKLFSFIKSKL